MSYKTYNSNINGGLSIDGEHSGIILQAPCEIGIYTYSLDVALFNSINFARERELYIFDAPKMANFFKNVDENSKQLVRNAELALISSKYLIKNKSSSFFMTTHSQGHLIDTNNSFYNRKVGQFVEIDSENILNSQNEFHYEDLLYNFKNTSKPESYTVYANLEKDKLIAHNKASLTYDEWMIDDIILMTLGGVEEREIMGDLLFKKEERAYIRNEVLPLYSFRKTCGGLIALRPYDFGLFTISNPGAITNFLLGPKALTMRNPGISLESFVIEDIIQKE